MKTLCLALSLLLITPQLGFSQTRKRKVAPSRVETKTAPATMPSANVNKANTTEESTSSAPATAPAPTKRVLSRFSDLSLGLITWQERIKASRAPAETNMLTQFLGLRGALGYNRFFSSSWRWHHTAEFTFGTIKGQGETTAIPDELKSQNFAMLTASPGLMARTSPVSEIGFGLPLSYRYTRWALKSGSGFTMDKTNSFSAGASFMYVNRFSNRSSMQIMLSHQHMWNAVQWALAWNYVL